MDFIITDREGIEKGVLVKSSYVVISIHDPDKQPPPIRKQPGFRASLVLSFDDAEEVPAMALPGEIVLMSRGQAKKIRRFIEKHREDVGAVVVHCEAGMSRSPGVAAALCRAFGQDDQLFWQEYQPNRHVYRLVLDVFKCIGREFDTPL
jgi:predicted protein tyrosine phosphatase